MMMDTEAHSAKPSTRRGVRNELNSNNDACGYCRIVFFLAIFFDLAVVVCDRQDEAGCEMSLFCRMFGCRRFRTVRIYKGFSARRVGGMMSLPICMRIGHDA